MANGELDKITEETKLQKTPASDEVLGFEDSHSEDTITPRIKVINALSPERVEKEAEEGDLINSLTKERLNGLNFIPVRQFYTNIRWNPERSDELRIMCRSFDGKIGDGENGVLVCEQCKKNQFDNTKAGKAAQPTCTAYINFLGFISGDPMPIVLSFSKTNYNEGKKLLSIAKSLRASAWNYQYTLESRKMTKDKNVWYVITTRMNGITSDEDRVIGKGLYEAFEMFIRKVDFDETEHASANIDVAADDVEI